MIEQYAIAAAEGWGYQQLLKNVTEENVPFKSLDVPCRKNKFTAIRRKFFSLLAKRKGLS